MRFGMVLAVAVAIGAMLAVDIAEARRLGGGISIGRQSSSVTQRQAISPARSAAPTQQARPSTAAQTGRSWLGPIAGLAAGFGLAALASHLGLSQELASLLLVLLFVFAAFMVIRLVLARRMAHDPSMQSAYAGPNVGAEASVRYSPLQDGSGGGSVPVVHPAAMNAPASGPWGVPADFDVEGFVRNAKVQFVRLQAAYDAADLADLREFTSPEMFAELRLQIHERGPSANKTDVVKLDAELLGIETGQS
ncbi:MAG: TIM44-like domain-containing protein, partial [Quisquiliibacterium sp.]